MDYFEWQSSYILDRRDNKLLKIHTFKVDGLKFKSKDNLTILSFLPVIYGPK
jgi:hypothetical protein